MSHKYNVFDHVEEIITSNEGINNKYRIYNFKKQVLNELCMTFYLLFNRTYVILNNSSVFILFST